MPTLEIQKVHPNVIPSDKEISSETEKETAKDLISRAQLGLYDLKEPDHQKIVFDYFFQSYLSGSLPQWTERDMNYCAWLMGIHLHSLFPISNEVMQRGRNNFWTGWEDVIDFIQNKSPLSMLALSISRIWEFDFLDSLLSYVSKKESALSKDVCYGLGVSFILNAFSKNPFLFARMISFLYSYSNSHTKEVLLSEEMKSIDALLHQIIDIQEQMNATKNIHLFNALLPDHLDYRAKYINFSELEMNDFLRKLEDIQGVKYLIFSENYVMPFYFEEGDMWLLDQKMNFLLFKIFLQKNRSQNLYQHLYQPLCMETECRFVACVMAIYPKEIQDTITPLFPCKKNFSDRTYERAPSNKEISSVTEKENALDVIPRSQLDSYDLKDPVHQKIVFDYFFQSYLSESLPLWTERDMNLSAWLMGMHLNSLFPISNEVMNTVRNELWTGWDNIIDILQNESPLNILSFSISRIWKFNFLNSILSYLSKEGSELSNGVCYGLAISFILNAFSKDSSLFARMISFLYSYSNSHTKEVLISEEMKSIDTLLHQIIDIQEQINVTKDIHLFNDLLPDNVDYRAKYINFSEVEMNDFLSKLEAIQGVRYLIFSKTHVISFYFEEGDMWLVDQGTQFVLFKTFLQKNRSRNLYRYLYQPLSMKTDFRFVACVMAIYPKEIQDTITPLFYCKESFSDCAYDRGSLRFIDLIRFRVKDWDSILKHEYMNMKLRQIEREDHCIDEYFLQILEAHLYRADVFILEILEDHLLLESLKPYWPKILEKFLTQVKEPVSILRCFDGYDSSYLDDLIHKLHLPPTLTPSAEDFLSSFLKKVDNLNQKNCETDKIFLMKVLESNCSIEFICQVIEKTNNLNYRSFNFYSVWNYLVRFASKHMTSFENIQLCIRALIQKGLSIENVSGSSHLSKVVKKHLGENAWQDWKIYMDQISFEASC